MKKVPRRTSEGIRKQYFNGQKPGKGKVAGNVPGASGLAGSSGAGLRFQSLSCVREWALVLLANEWLRAPLGWGSVGLVTIPGTSSPLYGGMEMGSSAQEQSSEGCKCKLLAAQYAQAGKGSIELIKGNRASGWGPAMITSCR